MVHLLDLVLVRVPSPVLRTRFAETARVLMAVLEAAAENVSSARERGGRGGRSLPPSS